MLIEIDKLKLFWVINSRLNSILLMYVKLYAAIELIVKLPTNIKLLKNG